MVRVLFYHKNTFSILVRRPLFQFQEIIFSFLLMLLRWRWLIRRLVAIPEVNTHPTFQRFRKQPLKLTIDDVVCCPTT